MSERIKGRRPRQKKEQKKKSFPNSSIEDQEISSLEDIAKVLEQLQFKKSFGGVDEQDVWEKIKVLDGMYRKLYFIQEQRYRIMSGKSDVRHSGQKKSKKSGTEKSGGADHD